MYKIKDNGWHYLAFKSLLVRSMLPINYSLLSQTIPVMRISEDVDEHWKGF